jgi:hypothetical protein
VAKKTHLRFNNNIIFIRCAVFDAYERNIETYNVLQRHIHLHTVKNRLKPNIMKWTSEYMIIINEINTNGSQKYL